MSKQTEAPSRTIVALRTEGDTLYAELNDGSVIRCDSPGGEWRVVVPSKGD